MSLAVTESSSESRAKIKSKAELVSAGISVIF